MEVQEWQPAELVKSDPFHVGLDPQKAEEDSCSTLKSVPWNMCSLVLGGDIILPGDTAFLADTF